MGEVTVSDRMVGWLEEDWKGQREEEERSRSSDLLLRERRRPVGGAAPVCPVSPSDPQWCGPSELRALGQGWFASSQLRLSPVATKGLSWKSTTDDCAT